MGRKKDEERANLIKQLGLENSEKNYSKVELKEMAARHAAKDAALDGPRAVTQAIAGDPPMIPAAEMVIPFKNAQIEDPFTGLTERQKLIARLRMRGLSQTAISTVVKVSQPIVSQELQTIKAWQIERGRKVDQDEVVGSTVSLYEEVEHRAWELYHGAEESSEKAKALAVVMQAREKNTKLLMDLGLLKKAAHEITHTLEVSPFVSQFQNGGAREFLGNKIVMEQLKALAPPTPDGVEDAEVVENEEEPTRDNTNDLAAPTPDTEDDI